MMLNEVVDAMAFAGEVVVAAYMLQTAMKLAIIPVAAITTILRIVFSLQEVVQPFVLPDLRSERRSIARCRG
jgi:hypothetical protein